VGGCINDEEGVGSHFRSLRCSNAVNTVDRELRPTRLRYQPMTMLDSIALRACSRSEPVSCM
jgi:hypothetical protein